MRPRLRRPGRLLAVAFHAALLILLAPLLFGDSFSLRAQANAEEYHVKAAFLFHFAQLVEWPAATFKDANAPLTFCTLGADPSRGALDETVSGKVVENRTIRVLHARDLAEAQACHLLFIGAGEKKRIPAVLASLKHSPTLTVGETEHFAREGGMIGFAADGNKVRFEINLDAARRAGLEISPKLLVLAKAVIGGSGGN